MSASNEKPVSNRIIGIDLGTTNSVVSIIENDVPVIIPNNLGCNTTPSVVRMGPNESVGEEARRYLLTDPQNTIFANKRLMGRKFDDPILSDYLATLPYATTRACNGDVWVNTDYGRYSPAQLGGKILAKMKRSAERYLGQPVDRAVVTVPAYFNDVQRQATKDAGRIAGLDVLRIINEPTAAALAYGLDKKSGGHVVVYDLGGGTFDVSVLELTDGVFHVKATNGDTFLGGADFDNEVVKWLVDKFEEEEGLSLLQAANIDVVNGASVGEESKAINGASETVNDKTRVAPKKGYCVKNKTTIKKTTPHVIALEKLRHVAETARKYLSTNDFYDVNIENLLAGRDLHVRITRDQLERIVARVAQRTVEPCIRAMRDAGIDKSQVAHVVVVGGMTRMPYIRQLVKKTFGCEPHTAIDPDEAVARGAAVQGGVLAGSVPGVLLLDVAPLSLGIEVQGGVFSKIVDRNTTIPFSYTETFSTSQDNQTEVEINIYQGERRMVRDNKLLGTLRLRDIAPAQRGIPQIRVTFCADANGVITVSAAGDSNNNCAIDLKPDSGLTEEEINRMVAEANALQIEDETEEKKALLRTEWQHYTQTISGMSLPRALTEKISRLTKMAATNDFNVTEFTNIFDEVKKIL